VFFKFGVEIGVKESIVNEPLVLKTLIFQNNAKSEVIFKQLINPVVPGALTITSSTPTSTPNLKKNTGSRFYIRIINLDLW
jgi:hypothetical protein